jgi:hypothetical protein
MDNYNLMYYTKMKSINEKIITISKEKQQKFYGTFNYEIL